MQQAFQNGLLVLSTHNVTTAFDSIIIERAASAYGKIFASLGSAIKNDSLRQELEVEPLKPLFRVR
jgi:hypothetical protein